MNEQENVTNLEAAAQPSGIVLPDLADVEARMAANIAAHAGADGAITGREVVGLQVAREDSAGVIAASETPPELGAAPAEELQGPTEYVVGYAFSPDGKEVALIEKLRPDWQAGKYNGIGGKVESGDPSLAHAMSREFGEEAGVYFSADRWLHFRTEEFYPAEDELIWVHHFAVMTSAAEWDAIHTAEEEKVVKLPYPLPAAEDRNLVYNMPYLVPMAYVLLHVAPERRPAP